MKLPTFDTYCPNTTAANALCFDLGPIKVWYSYKTVVAYQLCPEYISRSPKAYQHPPTVRHNDWGPTTSKHLNAIDGGDTASRVSGEVFETMLSEALDGVRV